jgi:hypothetical protein
MLRGLAKTHLKQLTLALGLSTFLTSALAHHGYTAKFDPEQPISISGLVSHLDWSNPHAHIFMVADINGRQEKWYVEIESPVLLELNGWDATTLKPGDAISVSGYKARDGSPQLWGEDIRLGSAGESVFSLRYPNVLASIPDSPSQPTPRWPDGQPRLAGAPGELGYWVPVKTVLVEDGVEVDMLPNGQLRDLADIQRVAPLQPWAQRLYEQRQRNHLSTDPTYLECRPPAGPRKFLVPYGIQLMEDRPMNRVYVISGGGNHDWHLIYTDGRAHDGGFQLDDGNELYYGRNVGHWEGDTFVVIAEGFNEKFWLPGGLPHTAHMRTTERLTRIDSNTLEYQLTIDDKGAYTRPWTSSWTLKWRSGLNPPENYCQDNRL